MEGNSPIFKDLKNPLRKIKEKIKLIDLKSIKEKNINLDIKKQIDKIKDNTYFKNMDNETKKKAAIVAGLIAISVIGYGIDKNVNAGYEVYIGEEVVGAVRLEEDAISIAEDLRQELSEKYGHNVVFSEDIRLVDARVTNRKITDDSELKKNMGASIDILVEGYALNINGEKVGVLNSQRDIDFIIEQIKAPYLQNIEDSSNIREINILEDIEVSKVQVDLREMSNQSDLISYIKNGSEEIRTHIVEVGESLWTIAKIYGTTMEELELANPEIKPTRMKPGDEVKLVLPTSKITVEIVRELEYTERIDYEVKVELNDNMFNTQQTTKVEGAYGESFVRANEITHNGIVFAKEVIEEEVIKEPVDKVVVRGTKEPPRTMATGAFMMPTRGRLTSPFGRRWGSFHRGIDLANRQGTAILAADGGRVVFSGYQGSYGYMVEIDHENGFRTRYAHCSRLLVSVGDRVYKGQTIANMGSTGRSTGSHLHFEVIRNGSHQNPSNYVR